MGWDRHARIMALLVHEEGISAAGACACRAGCQWQKEIRTAEEEMALGKIGDNIPLRERSRRLSESN